MPHNRLNRSVPVAAAIAATVVGSLVVLHPRIATVILVAASVALAGLAVRYCFLYLPTVFTVWITVGLYTCVGTLGALVLVAARQGDSAEGALLGVSPLLFTFPQHLIQPTAGIYLVSAAATLAGSYLYFLFTGRTADSTIRPTQLRPRGSGHLALVVLTTIALVALLLGLTDGVHTLLSRSDYIVERASNPSLLGIGRVLGVACSVMAGYVWAASPLRAHRLLALAVLALWLVIFLSLASRALAIGVVGFGLGILLGGQSTPRRRLLLIAALVSLVPLALAIPIYLRTSSEHGLLPYLATLGGSDPSAELPTLRGIFLNTLSTYVNTAFPAFERAPLPLGDLWISINPLPGGTAGWYGIVSDHHVNPVTPYSALGELANYGLPVLSVYCMGMGIMLTHGSVVAKRLLEGGHRLYGIAIVGIALLVPILSLQYPIRTVSRLLYYIIAISLVVYVVGLFWERRQRSPRSAGELIPHPDNRSLG